MRKLTDEECLQVLKATEVVPKDIPDTYRCIMAFLIWWENERPEDFIGYKIGDWDLAIKLDEVTAYAFRLISEGGIN